MALVYPMGQRECESIRIPSLYEPKHITKIEGCVDSRQAKNRNLFGTLALRRSPIERNDPRDAFLMNLSCPLIGKVVFVRLFLISNEMYELGR